MTEFCEQQFSCKYSASWSIVLVLPALAVLNETIKLQLAIDVGAGLGLQVSL